VKKTQDCPLDRREEGREEISGAFRRSSKQTGRVKGKSSHRKWVNEDPAYLFKAGEEKNRRESHLPAQQEHGGT